MGRIVLFFVVIEAFFTFAKDYRNNDIFADDPTFGFFVETNNNKSPSPFSWSRSQDSNIHVETTSATPDPISLGCGTAPSFCRYTKYRSIDGSCNNLKNPILGTPNTPYRRLLPANYGDGISFPTMSKNGQSLPLARTVSLTFFSDIPVLDHKLTLNAMQYGQIITHDMSMMAGNTQMHTYGRRCCSPDGQLLELANLPEHCFPIVLPKGDPIVLKTNRRCMDFSRTITDRDRRCVGGKQPAEQLTSVNHYLDLSIVYGNDDNIAKQLREFQGGRLKVDLRKGKQWPPRAQNASGTCRLMNLDDACYLAGDSRANQNPQLTLLHIIYLREHNRIADVLAHLNPQWNDEKIYQEARKINIAEHQWITYYEWLPLFIGRENSIRGKIIYPMDLSVDDYDENIDPSVINEHANAAFRYFHSLIVGHIDLLTENRQSLGSLRLSDWLGRPQVLEDDGRFDQLSRGLNTQPESASDLFHDREITHYLFRGDNETFGIDLKAFDIQRNRDHGLASYNDFRELWGLHKANSFEDFLDTINRENVVKLSSLYHHPDDVDLAVGASLEKHIPDTLVGRTFLNIITEQFYRTRVGDRFWFERPGEFTKEQLGELKKSSMSKLMCDNGHHINFMQQQGFIQVSAKNPLVSCQQLPSVNLEFWKEEQLESEWNPFSSIRLF